MNNNGYDQNGYNPPPPNYGQNPPPINGFNPQPPKRTNGMAVASLVLSIVGFVFSCCCLGLSLICSILAIIFAILSKRSEPDGRMNNVAVAGLIIGIIGAVVGAVVLVICFAGGIGDYSFNIDDIMNEFSEM